MNRNFSNLAVYFLLSSALLLSICKTDNTNAKDTRKLAGSSMGGGSSAGGGGSTASKGSSEDSQVHVEIIYRCSHSIPFPNLILYYEIK